MSAELDPLEYDYGYDPTIDEPIEITPAPLPELLLPPSAMVNTDYLPPVQKQSTPNCAAWASTYGLATFTAAKAGNYSPTDASQQASSAYIYIGVLEEDGKDQDTCTGSQLTSYFKILKNGGTPSMSQAPYNPECAELWTLYGSQSLSADPTFAISSFAAVDARDPYQVKQIIAVGGALAYGTSLYTDFRTYTGTPSPYVGNGVIWINPKTGKNIGHCMLIIGYDDNCGPGAFRIQNSSGPDWGDNGFVWMAYDTFTTLAQGAAFYVTA